MATITGSQYNEVLVGTADDDTINGLSGYDTLDGGDGSDTYVVNADDFQDRYVDFYGDTGTLGTDMILAAEAGIKIGIGSGFSLATSGIEIIDGLENSWIVGNNDSEIWDFTGVQIHGVSLIYGDGGNDNITGTEFADTIDGGDGHDTLNGGHGDDVLFGGAANDVINGGNGNDILHAGTGYDILDGGEGSDLYYVGLAETGQVNTYSDTGTDGFDRIVATEAGTVIGLNGFGPDSGIEAIWAGGFEGVTIAGSESSETLDFSTTRLGRKIELIDALGGHDTVIGNAQNNVIDGGAGHDVIHGNEGRDTLYGGDGNDIIFGGLGNDRLFAGTGYDTLDGGEGSDRYFVGLSDTGQVNVFNDTGTEGFDRILATEDNTVIGLNGFGPDSGIELIGARGNKNVTVAGNDAAQTLDFSNTKLSGIAMVNALGGHDVVIGNDQNNRFDGGDGHDILYGEGGNDRLYGGADNDILYGGAGRDKLFAGSGHDILDGGEGGDLYLFDTSSNEGSNDFVDTGTRGTDRVVATEDGTKIGFATVFNSENGIEVISGRRHSDVSIFGTAEDNEWDFTDVKVWGIDHIDGGLGDDHITGSRSHDTLMGSEGDDHLFGARGRDTLIGGEGDDYLNGGAHRDILTGGEGEDIFAMDVKSGRDTITDFTAGEDMIDLTAMEVIDSFDDLKIIDTDDGALIRLEGGALLLQGVEADSLNADMFLFGG